MAPEVILRKLGILHRLVSDLRVHENASLDEVERDHYRLERILELLATSAADLLQHILGEREIIANSYREVFRRAGEERLIDASLAERLENAAAMRNVLVHLYDEINLGILQQSISEALRDFPDLIAALTPLAEEE